MDFSPYDFENIISIDVPGGAHGGDSDDQSFVVSTVDECQTCPAVEAMHPESNQPSKCAEQVSVSDDWWEDIVVRNDVNYASTHRALEITERFIGDKNLILIGGMAIDMALKLAGGPGIYSNDKLPDYDFLSPNSTAHGSELARQLCLEKLPNVSAINAMHTTTIKVRCNFSPAADIGFCPQEIYDELPTLKIGRIRVIHPHFQIIDIHRSLSYPFDRAQVIGAGLFYRWKKDCTRYDLLLAAYPIKGEHAVDIHKSTILLDKDLLRGDCLAGWAALDYWMTLSEQNLSLSSERTISSATIPEGESIQVFTDDFTKYVSRAEDGSIEYYEAILGHLPRHVKLVISGQKYDVYDNYGALLSAEPVGPLYVANLQHCMLWLIENIYISARGASDEIKSYARDLYVECTKVLSGAEIPGLLPSINVFGTANLDESYLIGRRKFVARLSGAKLLERDVIDGIYPAQPKCISNISFDYDKSPYFAIAGKRCGAFMKREIPSLGSG